jgi:hypothetical protein
MDLFEAMRTLMAAVDGGSLSAASRSLGILVGMEKLLQGDGCGGATATGPPTATKPQPPHWAKATEAKTVANTATHVPRIVRPND